MRFLLQEIVEDAGQIFLFYPKFHRELNWIEYFWGRCKNFTRKHYNYALVGTVAHTASHWLMVFMLTPAAVPAALTPPQSVRL